MKGWLMRKGFKVSNASVRGKKTTKIACFNYTGLNEVVSAPYFSHLPVDNIVGVWKPKGSPSLL